VLGESNENHIVVDMGLKKGQKLYLSMPENPDNFKYAGLKLMEEIKRRKAEEEQKRLEMQEEMNRPKRPGNFRMPGGASGGTSRTGN